MRKQEIVVCNHCRKEFLKDSSEVKRNFKLNRFNYCSLSCSKKTKQNLELLKKIRYNNTSHLNSNNRKDKYSHLRIHYRKIQSRNKDFNLTLEDMLEIWNNQQGKCVYTKVDLQPTKYKGYNDPRYTMSVDRIDSTKGYTKSNIQFVSVSMNYMKHTMTHKQVLEYLQFLKYGA